MRALTVDRVVSTRVRRGSPNDCEELRRCRYRGRPWRMTRASALLAALAAMAGAAPARAHTTVTINGDQVRQALVPALVCCGRFVGVGAHLGASRRTGP